MGLITRASETSAIYRMSLLDCLEEYGESHLVEHLVDQEYLSWHGFYGTLESWTEEASVQVFESSHGLYY